MVWSDASVEFIYIFFAKKIITKRSNPVYSPKSSISEEEACLPDDGIR
jgi:hypothetical protein